MDKEFIEPEDHGAHHRGEHRSQRYCRRCWPWCVTKLIL